MSPLPSLSKVSNVDCTLGGISIGSSGPGIGTPSGLMRMSSSAGGAIPPRRSTKVTMNVPISPACILDSALPSTLHISASALGTVTRSLNGEPLMCSPFILTVIWYVPGLGAVYSILYRPSGSSVTVADVEFAGAENLTARLSPPVLDGRSAALWLSTSNSPLQRAVTRPSEPSDGPTTTDLEGMVCMARPTPSTTNPGVSILGVKLQLYPSQ